MSKEKMYRDVVVVGGSYSGLSAALALGRSRRRVWVADTGTPCNRYTPHSHNFLTRDGETPGKIRARALADVARYPTVSVVADSVVSVERQDTEFLVRSASGVEVYCSAVVLAYGLRDELPQVEGFAECWGKSVLHCPYCHGYEYADVPTGVYVPSEFMVEMASLIRNWSSRVTVFSNGVEVSGEVRLALEPMGVKIEESPLRMLEHEGGMLRRVHLGSGESVELSALYHRPRSTPQSSLAVDLGCEITPQGLISVSMFQQTSQPGVYACGDAASPIRSVAAAVFAGSMAGAALNRELANAGNFASGG